MNSCFAFEQIYAVEALLSASAPETVCLQSPKLNIRSTRNINDRIARVDRLKKKNIPTARDVVDSPFRGMLCINLRAIYFILFHIVYFFVFNSVVWDIFSDFCRVNVSVLSRVMRKAHRARSGRGPAYTDRPSLVPIVRYNKKGRVNSSPSRGLYVNFDKFIREKKETNGPNTFTSRFDRAVKHMIPPHVRPTARTRVNNVVHKFKRIS